MDLGSGYNAAKEYRIINLKKIDGIRAVIQASYVADNHLFFVRCGKTNAYLYRCALPTNGKDVDANKAEVMTLEDFGHTQTLEVYKHNKEWYALIGCKGVEGKDGYKWATQIARVKFQAGKTIKYTKCERLSGLNNIGNLGSIGVVRRAEAAMSTDNKWLLLWVRTYDDNKKNYKTRFAIYDAGKINDALDKLKNKDSKYLPCDNSEVVKALTAKGFEYTVKHDNATYGDLRYGSNQGLEINNSKEIYVCSEELKDYVSQGTYIYKLNSSGKILKKYLFKGKEFGKGCKKEFEGLQIRSGKLYFCYKDYAQNMDANVHYIYSFSPNAIG